MEALLEDMLQTDKFFLSEKIKQDLETLDLQARSNVLKAFKERSNECAGVLNKQALMIQVIDAQRRGKLSSSTKTDTKDNAIKQTRKLGEIKPRCSNTTKYAHDDAKIPDQIGSYRFLKTIGKGTFGKVKLAEHVVSGEKFAVKIVVKANLVKPKQHRCIQREIRLSWLLHHPNIIRTHEVLETKEFHVLVMEYANGGELFDFIVAHKYLKEAQARKFFRQIVRGVAYLHAFNVVHRDLKPENLLLTADFQVKVIDFGFGNTFHRGYLLDTFCGSPFYAAPEMTKGVKYTGPEVDIWSLGVILYTMLAGKMPFDAPQVKTLYDKIGQGIFHVPTCFSNEATDLISHMLVVDPNQRLTIQQIAHHPWLNIGFEECAFDAIPSCDLAVMQPNLRFVKDLVSYGYKEQDVLHALSLRESFANPIKSLYCLMASKADQEHRAMQIAKDTNVQKCIPRVEESIARPPLLHQKSSPILPRKTSKAKPNVHDESRPTTSHGQVVAPAYRLIAPKPVAAQPDMREVRGTFDVSTTTFKSYTEIRKEIVRVLLLRRLPYQILGNTIFRSAFGGNIFEIEICRVFQLTCNCIKFKRISGAWVTHHAICTELIHLMQL